MKEKEPYFKLRNSGIHGRGAFAVRKIRAGTRIAEYTGEMITDAEADKRYDDDDSGDHHTFLFNIGWGKNLDATVGGSDSRFINHSCDPNCEANVEKRRVFIDAIRTILPGEELNYDYQYARDGESDRVARQKYPCRCGADNCRGTIMMPLPRKRKKAAGKKAASKKKTASQKKTASKKNTASGKKTSSARKKSASKK